MNTWNRGRQILIEHLRSAAIPLQPFLESLLAHPPARVAGTSVFLTANPDGAPHALLHNLSHNQILHERVVVLTVVYVETPRVPKDQRVSIEPLVENCYRITVRYGFKDEPNLPYALELCERGPRLRPHLAVHRGGNAALRQALLGFAHHIGIHEHGAPHAESRRRATAFLTI